MKRRMLSIIIALALCLSLCPAVALAAENTAERTTRTVPLNLTNEDAENVAEGWSWKKTDADGYYYTLTLDNVNFEVSNDSAITFSMDKQTWLGAIYIVLIGENRVVSTCESDNFYQTYGIRLDSSDSRSPGEIVVSGGGSLTAEGYRCGIGLGTDKLHFKEATVNAQSAYPSGLQVTNGGSLLIEDSTVGANTISTTCLTSSNSDISVVLNSVPAAWTYNDSLIAADSVDISGGTLTLAGSEKKPAYNAIFNNGQTSINLSGCQIDIRNVQYGLHVNAGTINLTDVSGAVFCTESGTLLTSQNPAFHANEVNALGCSIYAQTGSDILTYGDCSLPSEITEVTIPGDLKIETGKTFTIGAGQKITFSKNGAQVCQYLDNTTLINNGTLEFVHQPTFRSGTKLVNNGTLIAPEGISYSKNPDAAQNAQVTNNGTFNGIVTENIGFTQYIYGNVTLGGNRALGALNGSRWMINKIFVMPDAVLTVPSGKTLDASQEGQGVTWDSLSEYLSVGGGGKIVVEEGGTLLLPPNPTQEQMNSLPVSGDGVIKFGEAVACALVFDSQGGSAVGDQTVLSGQPVVKPAAPTRTGYTFGGWYKEPGCETAWDFENDTITNSTTLYARWIQISVESVMLNKTSLTLTVGGSEQLTAAVAPSDAADKTVTWESSDTAVATVDSNGNVTAVSAGTATITVTTTDGGKTASCTVTVTAPAIHVTGITLDKTSMTLTVGGSERLTATVAPSDATDKSVTWASSNTAVATVDANGTITAVSTGSATITVTTADGAKTATCTVTVRTNSSGGGGGGTTTSPTVTVPVSGDKSTVHVSASVSGTTATVSKIDTSQIENVIGDNGQASMVEIDFTGLGKTIDTVKLPAAAIKDIAAKAQNEEVGGLTVKLPEAEISFDAKALSAIQAQAGSQITLTVTPAKPADLNSRQKEAVGSAPVFDLTLRSSSGAITDFRGGYATVSLPYTLAAGQNPSGVVVYYLDSTGNTTPCTTMYDVGRESAIFTTGHLSLYFVGYDPAAVWVNPFSDVTEGAWYYDAVRYASENGLMGGYGNGKFGPNDNLSRAQFAQILFNKEGRPVVDYLLRYNDVADGAWYTEAVRWATSQGVVSGYGNGMFGPNDNITREQLAVMLWRYAGSPATTEKELHFTDTNAVSDYALDALRWAVENGVINGYGDGRLGPKGLATRAQVAQMLKNYLER